MLIAAIDIGTNSTRLLIANFSERQITPLFTALETTRIGEGVGTSKLISSIPLSRTLHCLERYMKICSMHNVEKIRIVATSAVRDAKNKWEVAKRVYEKTGVELEILPGEKEAKFSFLGATCDLKPLSMKEHAVVLDIGGGSTELIYPSATGIHFKSVDLGAVRLSENEKLRKDVPIILNDLMPQDSLHDPLLVGVGGTITTLVAIKLGLEKYDSTLVHGEKLFFEDIRLIGEKLQELTLDERKKVKGLQPERADIILYGILILEKVMELLHVPQITVSEKDILFGMIIDAANGEY